MASEKITAIIESVKGLTVLELKELIDTYCEEFGVSAVAAAAPAAGGAAAPAEEEKTEFDVILEMCIRDRPWRHPRCPRSAPAGQVRCRR